MAIPLVVPLVANWLKSNWLLVVAGVCWAGSLGITLHYGYKWGASGKEAIKAEFVTYKKTQEAQLEKLQGLNAKDAIIANQKLRQQEYEREEYDRKHKRQLLALRQELDRVKLDAVFVELLNESARGGRPEPTPQPGQSRDGGPVQEADPPQGSNQGSGIKAPSLSLYDLGATVLENNKNHNECVDQVEAWQNFYRNLYGNFK
jgi:hypothetical protein